MGEAMTYEQAKRKVWYHEKMTRYYLLNDTPQRRGHEKDAKNLRKEFSITEHWRELNAEFRGSA